MIKYSFIGDYNMFTVLFTALLSFNLLSTNLKVTKLSSYAPEINVKTGTFEVDCWRERVIGRHQMVYFDSIDYLGSIEVKNYQEHMIHQF